MQNPYLAKRHWQRTQAARLKPSELEQDGSSAWQRMDTLSVRVYRDAAYTRRDPHGERFAELLEHANQTFQTTLHLRLTLESTRELPETIGAQTADLDALLDALVKLDPANDVPLVLALVGQNPIATYSFHELGRAQWLGRHMVMRSIDDIEEMRAFAEGLDTLSTDARTRLYTERKRHKEAAVLLHEVGHTLGALHVREENDLMHPNYHHTAVTFAAENVALMRFGLADRLAAEDARDRNGLAAQVNDYLTQSTWAGWYEGVRDEHLRLLAAALAQAKASPAPQTPPPAPQRVAAAAPPGPPPEDLTGLSAQDIEKYRAIEVARREHHADKAYRLVSELAEHYQENLTVQQKACDLGMAFGVEARLIVVYCGRASALQQATTSGGAR